MSKIIKPAPSQILFSSIARLTLDPWVGMLVLGGLADYLKIPRLAIGFIPCVLISIGIQAFSPYTVTTWTIEDE